VKDGDGVDARVGEFRELHCWGEVVGLGVGNLDESSTDWGGVSSRSGSENWVEITHMA
jgi:hypothetical protein